MITPFANESDSFQIGDLTVENHTDKISIYGSIDITRDRQGLMAALVLAKLLIAIIDKLTLKDLPESIAALGPGRKRP